MDYVIGEILLCLLAVGILASIIGWLLHGVFGQGKLKALEASKNLQLEELRGKLETAGKSRQEAAAALEKSTGQLKQLEAKLTASAHQLADAKGKHELEVGQWKQRVVDLEPLSALLAERESRLQGWNTRFNGLVQEKDDAIAALSRHREAFAPDAGEKAGLLAEIDRHATERDSLHARIVEHQQSLDEAHAKLQAGDAEKDRVIGGLQAKLESSEAAQDGLHVRIAENLKNIEDLHAAAAEKDAHIADLHLSLADHATEKDSMHALIADHQSVSATIAEKDDRIGGLEAKLAAVTDAQGAKLQEMSALLDQRDEQLRSFDQRMRGTTAEKDTIIGKLRSMVAQIEPLKQDLQQRDLAIEQMQKRERPSTAVQAPASPSAALEEVQRQLIIALASNSSLKAALEGKDSEIAALELRLKDVHSTHQGALNSTADRLSIFENQVLDVSGRHAAAMDGLDAYATRYAELDARLRQQTSDHDAATAALASKQEELARSRAELASLDTRTMAAMTQLQSRVAELEKSLSDGIPEHIHQTLTAKDAEIAELRAQLAPAADKATEHLALLENQVVDVTGRHAAAQGELDDSATRYAELDARLRQQTSDHDAATAALASKQEELARSRAELASLDTRTMAAMTQLQSRVAELEKSLSDGIPEHIHQTLTAKDAEIAELRAQLAPAADKATEHLALLENQVVDVTGRHAAAQGELDDSATRYAELDARLRQQTSDHDASTAALASKQEELARSRAELASLDTRTMAAMTQLQSRVAELEQSLADGIPEHIHQTLTAKDAEIAELRAQLAPAADKATEHLALLENQVVDVTGRHAAAQSDLDASATRNAELETRYRQAASDHEAAQRALAAKQVELEKAQLEIAQLDSKLVNIPSLEESLVDLRAQIADRDERLEAWDSRFHASIGDLHGEIGALTAQLHGRAAELNELRIEEESAPAKRMAAAVGFAGTTGTTFEATPPPQEFSRHAQVQELREFFAQGTALHGIQFLPSSAELIPQSLPILARAADALHRFPDVSVEIAGHTDSWGMPQDNLRLSQERAAAVKEYLINSGVAAWRLVDVGYGETRPIDSNDTADGRFTNRRIEFHVKQ